jgi:hypothetical protein
MGLLTGLLTLPLAPVRGTIWIAERLLDEAERELNDPAAIEQRLDEAEAAYERGELFDLPLAMFGPPFPSAPGRRNRLA